jgi:hypothetical protein
MNTEPRGEQPPEGLLLEQARDRMDISQNEAGRRAGITGTRWRQIVYEVAPTMTSPRGVKTLVRMARAVGVGHEQVNGVGRGDVADQMRSEQQPAEEPTIAELAAELEEIRRVNADLARRLEEIEARHRPRLR